MPEQPLISVIIPTYNRAGTITRAVQSIIDQVYQNWELLIIDDGSTDSTEERIKPFLKDSRISYYKQTNKGVSAARNYGLKIAKGNYISFLDSDDEFCENNFVNHLSQLTTKDYEISICNAYKIYDSGIRKIYSQNQVDCGIEKIGIIKNKYPLSASCLMFKRTQDDIFYDEEMTTSEDADFLLRKLKYNQGTFTSAPLVKNYRTLKSNRLSTDSEKLISGLKKRKEKILLNQYGLNSEERQLYSKLTSLSAAKLFLFKCEAHKARKNILDAFSGGKLPFHYKLLYYLSFSKILIRGLVAVYKRLYSLGISW